MIAVCRLLVLSNRGSIGISSDGRYSRLTTTRRGFMQLSLGWAAFATAPRLLAQGVAAHTVKPEARPAPSGRPFNAYFVDVATAAGLRAPVIYGGVDSKKYILEATGCGCAFIDDDNDGWVDIFLLSGTCLTGDPVGAINRLYKNNRDGTFTDVTEKAGLKETGWASSVWSSTTTMTGTRTSFAPTTVKTTFIATTGMGPLPTSRKAPDFGTTSHAGDRDAASWTTTGMAISTCSFRTACASHSNTHRCQGRM